MKGIKKKLKILFKRFKTQCLSPNREERKMFWRWLLSKFWKGKFPGKVSSKRNRLLHENRMSVFSLIKAAREEDKKIVCILAPIFTEERLKNGYYQRIKAIDDIMGAKTLKIYMSFDCEPQEQVDVPFIRKIDSEHIQLAYFQESEFSRDYASQVADAADILYLHGVGYLDEDIIRKKHLLKIVDLHGALPEEFAMNGNYPAVQRESIHEELAMRYADYIVCVTQSMVEHMQKKYVSYRQNYIVLPILSEKALNTKAESKTPNESLPRPVITYAGGMQSWQMIPEMQTCMRQQPGYDYRIYTAEPEKFWEYWGKVPALKWMLVESAETDQLYRNYRQCQYGFVLREDSIVNHVACPTKLIEYILNGIVPIMNTAHLGDFVKDGMAYLTMEDFCAGKLPDNTLREQMAQDNQKVIDRIIEKHQTGKQKLQQLIWGA